MNQRIVIHSLEELGQIAELIDLDDQEEVATTPGEPSVETVSDLASLAAAASRAAAQLQELVERDAVARRQAELALTQHHRLQEEVGQLERIAGEAGVRLPSMAERDSIEQLANRFRSVADSLLTFADRFPYLHLRTAILELVVGTDTARVAVPINMNALPPEQPIAGVALPPAGATRAG